jgi:hypothetical protein
MNLVTFNLQGVVRHMGLPVRNVTLILRSFNPGAGVGELLSQAVSGAKGEFQFDVPAGRYVLEVLPDATTCFVRQIMDDVNVVGNQSISLSLSTGCLLKGRIVNLPALSVRTEQNDLDIPNNSGAGIEAYYDETGILATASIIEHDGSFVLVLPRGRYRLMVVDTANREIPFIFHNICSIDVNGDATEEIELPQTTRFAGFIADGAKNAVANGKAQISSSMASQFAQQNILSVVNCRSNDEGYFQVDAQPGFYDFHVRAPELSPLSEQKEEGILVAPEGKHIFVLGPGVCLKGSITLEGKPLAGVTAELVTYISEAKNPAGQVVASYQTGDDGQYCLSVPEGKYYLRVYMSNSQLRRKRGQPAPYITHLDIKNDTTHDVGLLSGLPVNGKILSAKGGALPEALVSVFAGTREALIASQESELVALVSSLSDIQGQYYYVLAPGTYCLVVNDDFNNCSEITIAKEPIKQDINWTTGHLVRFLVVGEELPESPVARCKVIYKPYNLPDLSEYDLASQDYFDRGSSLTATNGVCQLTLPAGVYSFEFLPGDQSLHEGRLIKQLSIGMDLSRKVKLEPKREVYSQLSVL